MFKKDSTIHAKTFSNTTMGNNITTVRVAKTSVKIIGRGQKVAIHAVRSSIRKLQRVTKASKVGAVVSVEFDL
jgi:hypothetical protein